MKSRIFKTSIFILLCMSLFSILVFAEEDVKPVNKSTSKHEVFLGYTPYTGNAFIYDFANIFASSFASIFTDQNQINTQNSFFGIFGGYNYYINNIFFVGGRFDYGRYTFQASGSKQSKSESTIHSLVFNSYSITARAGVQYGWTYYRLSHALDLGLLVNDITYTITNNKKTDVSFAWNLTVIGMQIGPRRGPNINLDLGIGTGSLASIYASFRF